jgi:hypothetical protein
MAGVSFSAAGYSLKDSHLYKYYPSDGTAAAASGVDDDYSASQISVGIYLGAAPKLRPVGKLTVSFPILLQIRFGSTSNDKDSDKVRLNERLKASSNFGLDLLVSARAAYSLTRRWSIFTGFVFNIIEYTSYSNDYYKGPSTSDGTYTAKESFIGGLNDAKIQLGVRFTL